MAKTPILTGPAGVYASLVTPRRPGTNEVDLGVLLDYLDRVARAGVQGFVLFGAAGEFVHFDVPERIRTASLALRRSRLPILVNVSHSTLAGALALSESAINIGAAGLLLMPPYFYRYSDPDLYAFYHSFLYLVGNQLPVYLYNLPCCTNPLSSGLITQLSERPEIGGIYDASGDTALLHQLKTIQSRRSFHLWTGNERTFLEAKVNGADGIVSDLAAAIPELLLALNAANELGNAGRVNILRSLVQEFMDWAERFASPAVVKQAASLRGWLDYEPPFPSTREGNTEFEQFGEWFKVWLPKTLRECSAKA
jgi:dihydrodipicolinate synthase/N-acetylneuraminate lyase